MNNFGYQEAKFLILYFNKTLLNKKINRKTQNNKSINIFDHGKNVNTTTKMTNETLSWPGIMALGCNPGNQKAVAIFLSSRRAWAT